jgi:hypothetical protein
MKQASALALALLFAGLYTPATSAQSDAEWTTLIDGSNTDAFTQIGDANWRVVDGAIQVDRGAGFLVSTMPYGDLEMRVEFWASAEVNSGVFIRCPDAQTVGANECYEVNIFDQRGDQTYRTGAIVFVAEPLAMVNAADQWNTLEITARGSRLTVRMNGTLTVDVEDDQHARGPFALQYGIFNAENPDPQATQGTLKFRSLQIR